MSQLYQYLSRRVAVLCCLMSVLPSAGQSPNNGQPLNYRAPGLTIDSVIRYLNLSLTSTDTQEAGRGAQVAEFARTWQNRVSHNDSSGNDMFQQYLRSSLSASVARTAGNCIGNSGYSGNWTNIGPDSFTAQNLGMLFEVWASSNTNFLLASGYGGLFKSLDAGKNWTCISDNTPVDAHLGTSENC